tara:strand:+ start:1817 stop:2080 length:264 start_codon:yes stop_codon:yes gene_type:complete
MDIKSIVVGEITKQAEASVPQLKKAINDYVIETIQSKEFEEEWATAINKKINIPWMNEEQEQEMFEKLIDKGTDIFAGVMIKILEKK